MSVRLRKWTTKEGKVLERWTIDVKVALPGQRPRRIRDFSPVNTRRGALQYERQVREALLAGTLGKEVKEVPTLDAFQALLSLPPFSNLPGNVDRREYGD